MSSDSPPLIVNEIWVHVPISLCKRLQMDGEVHRLEHPEAQEMDGEHCEQLDGDSHRKDAQNIPASPALYASQRLDDRREARAVG